MRIRVPKIPEIRLTSGLLPFLLLGFNLLTGQEVKSLRTFDFRYGFQIPAADMRDRFGNNNALGLGIDFASFKSRWYYGIEGIYVFGNRVKEDVLAPLRSYDGNIIGIDGKIADVNLKERGYYAGLQTGYIFKTTGNKNELTGIRTLIGVGLMQHKIRVQDNYNSVVPLEKKYLQGYDRLSNGPALHLGIGYQYDSPVNNVQFRIMGEVFTGKTKSRRDLDYPTGQYLDHERTDILYGLHIAYIVTISRTSSEEYIYY